MEVGEEVIIKKRSGYGEREAEYLRGKIIKEYRNHVLVEFEFKNGNKYMESFSRFEIEGGEYEDIYKE